MSARGGVRTARISVRRAGRSVGSHPHLITASMLGAVESGVSRGQQLGELASAGTQRGDADGHGEPDDLGTRIVAHVDGHPGDVGAHTLGDTARILLISLRKQEGKFFATEATNEVVFA